MKYNGTVFKYRKFDRKKLMTFGFTKVSDIFVYKTNLLEDTFELTVKILPDETIETRLVELATEEDYNLIYVNGAEGEFVGKIKSEFEEVLNKIKDECTIFSAFQTEYAFRVIDYIKEKYGDTPEYLWEKFPNNAIFRRKTDSKTKGKWYAALLTAKKETIGLNGNGEIEVINLKAAPEEIEKLIDNKKYFPGYHMNKKHWLTICLDGSVSLEEIQNYIDKSYNIVFKG